MMICLLVLNTNVLITVCEDVVMASTAEITLEGGALLRMI